jgi:hypothetical protein
VNTLPFVFAFILILSLSAHTLLQLKVDTHFEEMTYSGAMQAQRFAADEQVALRAETLKNVAKKINGKGEKNITPLEKEEQEVKKRSGSFESKRVKESVIDSPAAKFNLAPLLTKTKNNHHELYYEAAARLIKILYGQSSIFLKNPTPDLEYHLLDELIRLGQLDEKDETFLQFHRGESSLSDSLFKMLKGTQECDLTKQIGYPPLSDYFIIDRKRVKKALYFCFASKTLLDAAFGEKISEEIMKAEEALWRSGKKRYVLTLEELNALLQKNTLGKSQSQITEIFNFLTSASSSKQEAKGKDEKTQIKVKQNPLVLGPVAN